MTQYIYTITAWTNTGVSEFVEILATDSAKECVCKKFIKDQKVIILTRVTNDMLSSGQQNCSVCRLVFKPLLTWVREASNIFAASLLVVDSGRPSFLHAYKFKREFLKRGTFKMILNVFYPAETLSTPSPCIALFSKSVTNLSHMKTKQESMQTSPAKKIIKPAKNQWLLVLIFCRSHRLFGFLTGFLATCYHDNYIIFFVYVIPYWCVYIWHNKDYNINKFEEKKDFSSWVYFWSKPVSVLRCNCWQIMSICSS